MRLVTVFRIHQRLRSKEILQEYTCIYILDLLVTRSHRRKCIPALLNRAWKMLQLLRYCLVAETELLFVVV